LAYPFHAGAFQQEGPSILGEKDILPLEDKLGQKDSVGIFGRKDADPNCPFKKKYGGLARARKKPYSAEGQQPGT
jgi:hypothetical protein